MVRIVNYIKRESDDGREFFVLELQGGVEIVKSQQTQKNYITARKTTIPSTFDEMTCQSLIGSELPGKVVKVECDPYEYTIKDTGEVIVLTHSYEYMEEDQAVVERSNTRIDDVFTKASSRPEYSENGELVH